MSSTKAKSYHSITIGNKNTWDDWHLVPASRPLVNPPQVKSDYIDLSGVDGLLDMTTLITKKPTYQNRTGSWTFIVINKDQLPYDGEFVPWSELYSNIMGYLHGKSFHIILDDEPGYYYQGRVAVNDWKSSKGNSTITLNYNLDPYKRSVSNPNSKTL